MHESDKRLAVIKYVILYEQINVHYSVKSVLSFNLRMWSQAKLDPVADTANYTCGSTSNSVGDGVSSTTFFRVECEYIDDVIRFENGAK